VELRAFENAARTPRIEPVQQLVVRALIAHFLASFRIAANSYGGELHP